VHIVTNKISYQLYMVKQK